MVLEAVTICVNYSDYLSIVLPRNKPLFDKWIIVTSPQDVKTRDLCLSHGLTPVITDVMYQKDYVFDKGACINVGFNHLTQPDWVVHVDADIVLPPNLHQAMAETSLTPENIYSMPRRYIPTQEDWEKYLLNPLPPPSHGTPHLGYFQMFSPKSQYLEKTRPWYSSNRDASKSDYRFLRNWPKENRKLLHRAFCLHLGPVRVNWEGRVSPFWKTST